MYLLHSRQRLEAGTSITKGYERSLSAQGWEQMMEGQYARPWGIRRLSSDHLFPSDHLTKQGLLFHDKTPFRISPKLCYGLGGRNCILCLNALMFIWNGYVQVSLMLYFLKIIKLHSWIINFVSPLEAVPECPFQSAVLRTLQSISYWLPAGSPTCTSLLSKEGTTTRWVQSQKRENWM